MPSTPTTGNRMENRHTCGEYSPAVGPYSQQCTPEQAQGTGSGWPPLPCTWGQPRASNTPTSPGAQGRDPPTRCTCLQEPPGEHGLLIKGTGGREAWLHRAGALKIQCSHCHRQNRHPPHACASSRQERHFVSTDGLHERSWFPLLKSC